jgi:hypothetical protein
LPNGARPGKAETLGYYEIQNPRLTIDRVEMVES